jgi:hypothetical protein
MVVIAPSHIMWMRTRLTRCLSDYPFAPGGYEYLSSIDGVHGVAFYISKVVGSGNIKLTKWWEVGTSNSQSGGKWEHQTHKSHKSN